MRILISFLFIIISSFLFSQRTFYISEELTFADLNIKIGKNVSLPDIAVDIGEDIPFEDFTVGITHDLSKADFIIVRNERNAGITIRAGDYVPFADLTIRVGKNVPLEDLRIEIRESEDVDYLVYSEKALLSIEDLVIALLPVIDEYVNGKYQEVISELD